MIHFKHFIFFFLLLSAQLFAQPKVLIFYSVDCPMCIRETLTIRELQKKYSKILFQLIFSNTGTSKKELNQYKEKYLLQSCDFILDSNRFYKNLYKAKVTPEVFLLTESKKIIYSGAINNSLTSNQQKKNLVTKKYLEDAIEQFLNNKPVQNKHTKSYGCLIE